MTERELRLLHQLLQAKFTGAEALRAQLAGEVLVTEIDADGSFKLECPVAAAAPVKYRIPTEATYTDADGVVVHVLLHVVDGRMHELEVLREDSAAVILAAVDVETLKVRSVEDESWCS